MNRRLHVLPLFLSLFVSAAALASGQNQISGSPGAAQARVQREVMHELLMLPYYTLHHFLLALPFRNTIRLGFRPFGQASIAVTMLSNSRSSSESGGWVSFSASSRVLKWSSRFVGR